MLTSRGNGDCVTFISMKALGLLAVYQGFLLEASWSSFSGEVILPF